MKENQKQIKEKYLYVIYHQTQQKEMLFSGSVRQSDIEDLIHLIQLEFEEEITISELATFVLNSTELEMEDNKTNFNHYEAVYMYNMEQLKEKQKYLKDLYQNPYIISENEDKHEVIERLIYAWKNR